MRTKSGRIVAGLGIFILCASALGQTPAAKTQAANSATGKAAAAQARHAASNPVHGKVKVGVGFLDQNSYKFGEWTGITGYGPYPILNVDIGQAPAWNSSNPNYWEISGSNLGLPSRTASATVGTLGSYSLEVSYQGIPHYQWQNAQTPYSLVNGNYLRLPANFGGLDTSSETAYNQSVNNNLKPNLHDVNLKTQRDISKAIYRVRLDKHWSVVAEVRHDHKDGLIDFGSAMASFGGGGPNSILVPLPISYNINQLRLETNYRAGALNLAVGYLGSFYHDNLQDYMWDNPYLTPTNNSGYGSGGRGLAATPPDNVFHQMLISGSWGMPVGATRVVWDAAYGLEEQSAALLPYTINPNIAITHSLPVQNPNMEVKTTQANLRFVTSPLERMELSASFRYDNHADDSPTYGFYPVTNDTGAQSTTPFYNLPYSYQKRSGELSLAYNFGGFRPFLKYKYEENDQSFVEVGTTQSNNVSGGVSWQPGEITQIRLTGGYARRHGSPYLGSYRYQLEEYGVYNPAGDTNPQNPANFGLWSNDPLLQMFWLADRTRRSAQLSVNITPTGPFSVGVDAQYLNDDYSDSTLGVLSSKTQTYTAEAGYYPARNFGLTLYGTYQRMTQDQAGIAFQGFNQAGAFNFNSYWLLSSSEPVYEAGLDIDGKQLKLGLRSAVDLKFNLAYTYTSDQLVIGTGSAQTASAGEFPNITTRLLHAAISGSYPLMERLSMRLGVGWERYLSTNWHFTGVHPWTIGSVGGGSLSELVLGTGQQAPNYTVTWVSLALNYRF